MSSRIQQSFTKHAVISGRSIFAHLSNNDYYTMRTNNPQIEQVAMSHSNLQKYNEQGAKVYKKNAN